MRSVTEVANGIKTTFTIPSSPLTKFCKVAGVLVTLSAQSEISVTPTVMPTAGQTVETFFGTDLAVPPGTVTASFNGAAMPAPIGGYPLTLLFNITAVSGTSPTMNAKVQILDAPSGSWVDFPGAFITTQTAVGVAMLNIGVGLQNVANVSVNLPIRNIYRVVVTIGGTTPSFTFSVSAQAT
ncbi:MAG: hypothetical protein ABIR54_22325 [Burkholderiaceae bacterium]